MHSTMRSQGLHAECVTVFAQDVIVKRKTTASLRFRRQRQSTVLQFIQQVRQLVHSRIESNKVTHLATVAVDVKRAVERDDANSFRLTRVGYYRLPTNGATRRKFPVFYKLIYKYKTQKNEKKESKSLVKVVDAIYSILRVYCEGYAVETFAANGARETGGMVRFARCAQNAIQNGSATH